MSNKRIILSIFTLCVSTLMFSCSSSKKSGCYYSTDAVKEVSVEKKTAPKAYRIAD